MCPAKSVRFNQIKPVKRKSLIDIQGFFILIEL